MLPPSPPLARPTRCVTADPSEAARCYSRALELAPTYAPACYNMGVLHAEAKQVS